MEDSWISLIPFIKVTLVFFDIWLIGMCIFGITIERKP